jgi:hypothetical protein
MSLPSSSLGLLRLSALLPILALPLMMSCIDDDKDDDDDEEVDTDGDGLFDDEDPDPENPDIDGDGLLDGAEVEMGTDPEVADSDGDGYDDGDEVTEGTDPTDPDSVIYTGGWPYNGDKDSLEDPGWNEGNDEGDMFPRFAWTDQYGETVDMYDFSMQGKPVVVDLSGIWCYWCHEMASRLDHENSAYDDYADSFPGYSLVPELVDSGDILWVTVIDSDSSGNAPEVEDLEYWVSEHPNPNIAVLLDADGELTDWFDPYGYPTLLMLEEDMTVGVYDKEDYTQVFAELEDRYGE